MPTHHLAHTLQRPTWSLLNVTALLRPSDYKDFATEFTDTNGETSELLRPSDYKGFAPILVFGLLVLYVVTSF